MSTNTNTNILSGYGTVGYGLGLYGHPTEPEPEPEPEPTLTIALFEAGEIDPSGPHVIVRTEWGVIDTTESLAHVTITIVRNDAEVMATKQVDVAGGDTSGSWRYRIRHGAGYSYTVTLTAITSDGRADTATRTIPQRSEQ